MELSSGIFINRKYYYLGLDEGDESPEKITYQAASPDEAALVTAAKNFGFFFYRFVMQHLYGSLLFIVLVSFCCCVSYLVKKFNGVTKCC